MCDIIFTAARRDYAPSRARRNFLGLTRLVRQSYLTDIYTIYLVYKNVEIWKTKSEVGTKSVLWVS